MKFGVGGKIFPESQMNFGAGVVFFLRIEAKLEASGTKLKVFPQQMNFGVGDLMVFLKSLSKT